MTTTPLRIVVAINPTASFGARRETGPRIVDELRRDGHEVTALLEPDFASLTVAARSALSAADGDSGRAADALVVVGGDGMVSLGVNLLAGTAVPLGIIPSGTGNDMARGLGIPLGDEKAALEYLRSRLDAPPRRIDAGRVRHGDESTWFACALSAGFDALANERANRMSWPRGASRYILALLRELITLKPIVYRLEVDGVASELSASLIAVSNNRSLGGGMMITPDALVDDGKLDLFVVSPVSRLRFLRLFPKVFSGGHTGLDIVRIERVSRVRLAGADVVAYADGERVGPLPVEVEVVPGALLVYC